MEGGNTLETAHTIELKEDDQAVAAEVVPGVWRRGRQAKPALPLRNPHKEVRSTPCLPLAEVIS